MRDYLLPDTLLSILVFVSLMCLILIYGDSLYVGFWYYLLVFFVSYLIAYFFYSYSFFQFGSSLSVVIIFLLFLNINWGNIYIKNVIGSDDMLGILHLFSLPGMAIGILISANKCSSFKNIFISKKKCFWIGFFGSFFGFLINLIIVSLIMYL